MVAVHLIKRRHADSRNVQAAQGIGQHSPAPHSVRYSCPQHRAGAAGCSPPAPRRTVSGTRLPRSRSTSSSLMGQTSCRSPARTASDCPAPLVRTYRCRTSPRPRFLIVAADAVRAGRYVPQGLGQRRRPGASGCGTAPRGSPGGSAPCRTPRSPIRGHGVAGSCCGSAGAAPHARMPSTVTGAAADAGQGVLHPRHAWRHSSSAQVHMAEVAAAAPAVVRAVRLHAVRAMARIPGHRPCRRRRFSAPSERECRRSSPRTAPDGQTPPGRRSGLCPAPRWSSRLNAGAVNAVFLQSGHKRPPLCESYEN